MLILIGHIRFKKSKVDKNEILVTQSDKAYVRQIIIRCLFLKQKADVPPSLRLANSLFKTYGFRVIVSI